MLESYVDLFSDRSLLWLILCNDYYSVNGVLYVGMVYACYD